jgi:hypothetical protein
MLLQINAVDGIVAMPEEVHVHKQQTLMISNRERAHLRLRLLRLGSEHLPMHRPTPSSV